MFCARSSHCSASCWSTALDASSSCGSSAALDAKKRLEAPLSSKILCKRCWSSWCSGDVWSINGCFLLFVIFKLSYSVPLHISSDGDENPKHYRSLGLCFPKSRGNVVSPAHELVHIRSKYSPSAPSEEVPHLAKMPFLAGLDLLNASCASSKPKPQNLPTENWKSGFLLCCVCPWGMAKPTNADIPCCLCCLRRLTRNEHKASPKPSDIIQASLLPKAYSFYQTGHGRQLLIAWKGQASSDFLCLYTSQKNDDTNM